MDNNTSLLSTVLFSTIQQWDVKQFFLTKIKSRYVVEELGKHLIHQTEKFSFRTTRTRISLFSVFQIKSGCLMQT